MGYCKKAKKDHGKSIRLELTRGIGVGAASSKRMCGETELRSNVVCVHKAGGRQTVEKPEKAL